MKILLVTEFFPPHVGGVEVEFWEFSRRLVRYGDSVTVVTSASAAAPGHQRIEGVDVYRYPWKAILNKPIGEKADIRRHTCGVNVVMTSTFSTALPTLAVARSARIPCVLSLQELAHKRYAKLFGNVVLGSLLKWYEKRVVTAPFDAWHAISESTRRDAIVVGAPADRIHTILLGVDDSEWNPGIPSIDLASFFGFTDRNRVFLFFGRAGVSKGLDVLIEAIRLVSPSLPRDIGFGFILGDHPRRARQLALEQLSRLGLDDIVHIRPSVDRQVLPAHVKGATCVVIPSRWEGFGFSAAETCQLGVPVIASDAGSLPEVISGKHLFFQSENSRDLADKILHAAGGLFDEIPYKPFTWSQSTAALRQLLENTAKS
jgi:glycosyltransferase involved in cell wall biosynthesis